MPCFLWIWAMMRPSCCCTADMAFAFTDIAAGKKQTETKIPSGPTPSPLPSFLAGPSCCWDNQNLSRTI
jgi:hypothetical protein